MSDDFDFDPNDLFDDFDDDDDLSNVIGDDFDNDDDDLRDDFGDDSFDDFDEEFDEADFDSRLDFVDEDDEFGAEDDEFAPTTEPQQDNTFRNLVIGMSVLALIMVLIFGGIFAFRTIQDNEAQVAFHATSEAIEIENMTRQAQIEASATAAIENQTATMEAQVAATQTADAETFDATQNAISAAATANVVSLTETQAAIEQATIDAEATNAQATIAADSQFELAATQTAIAVEQTLNPPTPILTPDDGTMPTVDGSVSLPAVQQTATALALIFNATPTQADIEPTIDPDLGIGGGNATSPSPISTQDPGSGGGEALPNTGLFDDVFGGNPIFIILLAFGLLGVIIVSRGIRSTNRSET